MKTHTRVLAAVTGAALLVGAMIGGSAQAAKPKGPVVVGTDAADDWGSNFPVQEVAPLGNALGQELVEAAIEKKDAKTLNFIIKVAGLPPTGGVPELTRYVWTMTVDGTLLQLDGKFTNYSRGACDPTAGTCPPPRDPGSAPFMVRGNCTDNGGAAVTCEEIGLVNGAFDAATGTITVPVPLELLGAKAGSKIAHGFQGGSNFQGVWAIPSAIFSQGDMPLDELIITKVYTVPRK
ncbi:MAG: hypothetical protein M3229_02005 [Actinomycetota bacterium]|nr:hypothetical protein [Actinomycetota bacterium]